MELVHIVTFGVMGSYFNNSITVVYWVHIRDAQYQSLFSDEVLVCILSFVYLPILSADTST